MQRDCLRLLCTASKQRPRAAVYNVLSCKSQGVARTIITGVKLSRQHVVSITHFFLRPSEPSPAEALYETIPFFSCYKLLRLSLFYMLHPCMIYFILSSFSYSQASSTVRAINHKTFQSPHKTFPIQITRILSLHIFSTPLLLMDMIIFLTQTFTVFTL